MGTKIRISSIRASFRGYEPRLRRVAKVALEALNAKEKSLDILIADAAEMKRLNRKFRGIGKATDVLSFSARAGTKLPDKEKFLGDIAICFDLARNRSRKIGSTIFDELSLYLVHGILHLLGWEHISPQKKSKMEKLQEEVLLLCREGH